MPKTKYIAICVPSLGRVSMNWAVAFGDMINPMNYATTKIILLGKPTAEARNEIVVRAMNYGGDNAEVTHLFWIDDDVLINRMALVQLFNRHVPIVSGVYFSKFDPGEPLIFPGPCQGTLPFKPGEYAQVWGHGMGLTLVEMNVYRRMQLECDLGTDQFGYPQWYKTIRGEPLKVNDELVVDSCTEDLYFCANCEKLGIPRMVDMNRAAFGFHFDMNAQDGYPTKQWLEFKTTGRFTWDTESGPVTWER